MKFHRIFGGLLIMTTLVGMIALMSFIYQKNVLEILKIYTIMFGIIFIPVILITLGIYLLLEENKK